MADRIRYLDLQLGTGANDGTTEANAYRTWGAVTAINVVTSGDDNYRLLVKNTSGTIDGPGSLGTGWTTDASHRLIIEANDSYSAANGGRHEGLFGSGCRLRAGSFANALSRPASGPTHVTLVGLTFTAQDSNSNALLLIQGAGTLAWEIDGCIFQRSGGGVKVVDLTGTYSGTIKFRNCVIDGGGTQDSGIHVSSSGVTVYVNNCTIHDCGLGNFAGNVYEDVGTLNCKNVLCTTSSARTLGADFGSSPTMLNCASRDSTATGTGAITGLTDMADLYEDEANSDFRLKTTANVYELGADLSADSNYAVTNDFLLVARTVPFDIGAHEKSVAVVAGISTRVLLLGVGR